MLLTDWLYWIKKSILTNRQRSWLTAIGIAIGIAAVALLTSIGEGVRVYLINTFSQFGTRIVAIQPGKVSTAGMNQLLKTQRPLTLQDAIALKKIPHLEYMVPGVYGTSTMKAGIRSRQTDVMGVGPDAAVAWRMKVTTGRFLPQDDLNQSRPYAVLGAKLRKELFANKNPLGEFVHVDGQRFRVIGVMQPKGQFLGFDLDDVIYIPVDKALSLYNREGLMEINLVYSDKTTSKKTSQASKEILIARHGAEDFTLFTQDDMLSSMDSILNIIKFAVGALGSISLFVGAVGVLTIMTTALAERVNEIGLLNAIGATRSQLLFLFLGEAAFLATLGGILGLLVYAVLNLLMFLAAPDIPISPQPLYLLLALLLSALIGIVAGIYPAWKASRLNPIEALRAE